MFAIPPIHLYESFWKFVGILFMFFRFEYDRRYAQIVLPPLFALLTYPFWPQKTYHTVILCMQRIMQFSINHFETLQASLR